MQEISAFAFSHELELFLHPLLGTRGSEDTAVRRLVHTPMGDWKLMLAPAVCECALASPNVCIKDIVWSIEKICTAPLPSMVVNGMLLELLNIDVKEGLVVGAKRVILSEATKDLPRLEVRRLFMHQCER